MNNYNKIKLGLGTGNLYNQEICIKTVEHALSIGYRHIDTASIYENEQFISQAIDNYGIHRDKLFITTKLHSQHLSRQDVLTQTRLSRRKLGVDCIDVLYVHWPAHTYDPLETMRGMEWLKDCGMIKNIGVCNFTIDLLQEAQSHLESSLDFVQIEYHPLLQQNDIYKYALENDLWTVAYSPLAKGNLSNVPELKDISNKYGVSEYQVSLAWILNKDKMAAIPSATGDHLTENFRSNSIKLEEKDIEKINSLNYNIRYTDYKFSPWN